jgi:hypothetical protein
VRGGKLGDLDEAREELELAIKPLPGPFVTLRRSAMPVPDLVEVLDAQRHRHR